MIARSECMRFLGPGVTLCGNVAVGAAAHIGTGATILEKIEVGENSVVGGGSMVIRHLEPNVTAVGVPAQSLSDINNGLSKRDLLG